MEGYTYAPSKAKDVFVLRTALFNFQYICTPHLRVAATGGVLSIMNVLR